MIQEYYRDFYYPLEWRDYTGEMPRNDRLVDRMDSLINLCNAIKMLHKMGGVSEQIWDLDVKPSIFSILEEISWRVQTLIDEHCIE